MSMNLTLKAKNGEDYPLTQTSTEVTDHILASKDRYQTYVQWLRTQTYWNWKNPRDVKEFKDLKAHLRKWLVQHPNHTWSRE